MPYPNRSQWAILWLGFFGAFSFWAGRPFFESLGNYTDFDGWLLPVWLHRYGNRYDLVPLVVFTLLLVWQFSRPVRLRSAVLIPILFVGTCLTLAIIGATGPQLAERRAVKQWQRAQEEDALDRVLKDLPPAKPR